MVALSCAGSQGPISTRAELLHKTYKDIPGPVSRGHAHKLDKGKAVARACRVFGQMAVLLKKFVFFCGGSPSAIGLRIT